MKLFKQYAFLGFFELTNTPAFAQSKGINFDGMKESFLASIDSGGAALIAIVAGLISIGCLFWAGKLVFSGRWEVQKVGQILVAAIICGLVSGGIINTMFTA